MSGGGVSVNRESLVQRLQTLNISQQSIEGTSKWCLFYVKDAKTVVNIWAEEFGRASPERRIAFLYLANHILQVSHGLPALETETAVHAKGSYAVTAHSLGLWALAPLGRSQARG